MFAPPSMRLLALRPRSIAVRHQKHAAASIARRLQAPDLGRAARPTALNRRVAPPCPDPARRGVQRRAFTYRSHSGLIATAHPSRPPDQHHSPGVSSPVAGLLVRSPRTLRRAPGLGALARDLDSPLPGDSTRRMRRRSGRGCHAGCFPRCTQELLYSVPPQCGPPASGHPPHRGPRRLIASLPAAGATQAGLRRPGHRPYQTLCVGRPAWPAGARKGTPPLPPRVAAAHQQAAQGSQHASPYPARDSQVAGAEVRGQIWFTSSRLRAHLAFGCRLPQLCWYSGCFLKNGMCVLPYCPHRIAKVQQGAGNGGALFQVTYKARSGCFFVVNELVTKLLSLLAQAADAIAAKFRLINVRSTSI